MNTSTNRRRRVRPPKKPDSEYVALWRLVDAGVMDTFRQHPEYLAYKQEWIVRNSLNKRIVGNIRRFMKGFVEQSTKGRTA